MVADFSDILADAADGAAACAEESQERGGDEEQCDSSGG
jgi:hypothetical protein